MRWDFKKPVEVRSRVEIELMDTFHYLREVEECLKRIYSLATSIQAVLAALNLPTEGNRVRGQPKSDEFFNEDEDG